MQILVLDKNMENPTPARYVAALMSPGGVIILYALEQTGAINYAPMERIRYVSGEPARFNGVVNDGGTFGGHSPSNGRTGGKGRNVKG